jgi:hypothetical protein
MQGVDSSTETVLPEADPERVIGLLPTVGALADLERRHPFDTEIARANGTGWNFTAVCSGASA